ncbi:7943_t:CDS:1, partial [Acaulospora colombiana]
SKSNPVKPKSVKSQTSTARRAETAKSLPTRPVERTRASDRRE